MKPLVQLSILAVAVALSSAAAAQSPRAFSDLAFGDSAQQVERKTRAALDDGRFRRDCYGCPVRARVGDLSLELTTDFHEDRLWRVSLRHHAIVRGSGDAPVLDAIWTDLRDMIAFRHGPPHVSRGHLPHLPGHHEVGGDVSVTTHRWTPPGRRIELGVHIRTEYERTRESLWARIQNGWAFEDEPDKLKVVHYEVEVQLVDTRLERVIETGARTERQRTQKERIHEGGELF